MSGLMPLGRNPPTSGSLFLCCACLAPTGPRPPPHPLHCPLPSSLGRSFLAPRLRAEFRATQSGRGGSAWGTSATLATPVAADPSGARVVARAAPVAGRRLLALWLGSHVCLAIPF